MRRTPDAHEKLAVLADASRFDVSCACGNTNSADHRRRGRDGMWVYPASVPRGGESILLKTLLSNACTNDCLYCPFRSTRDCRRVTLAPETVAEAFMGYLRRGAVHGLFLSSGVVGSPDATMQRMVAVGELLRRKHEFGGFLHLKIIPGASDAAVEAALSVADTVSLNLEAPTRSAFARLSTSKDYERDVVRPLKLISRLTAAGNRHEGVCQMTQFVVGAADESDAQIVTATHRLYRRLGLKRVFFSAYQMGLGDPGLPGERNPPADSHDLLTREHRLYQVDYLLRLYRFGGDEIPFGPDGNLSLKTDPKRAWAGRHPEFFPLDANRAGYYELLRVPGIGPVTAKRIMAIRRRGGRVRSLRQVGQMGRRLREAATYVKFADRPLRQSRLPLTA